jgi:hypothetical protein
MLPSFKLKSLLSLTAAAFLLTAGSASAAPDAPWSGTGTATTTVLSTGMADDAPAFAYNVAGFKGAWEFKATSKSARKQPIAWNYKGFHSWASVRVAIEKYVVRGGKEIVKESLASAGPVSCCTTPSNGFEYKGDTTFDLQPGDVYGFRMSGSHNDIAQKLGGTLKLQSLDVTPPTVTPVITGKLGKNGYYTSDVKVAWQVDDPDSAVAKGAGCADATVTADTEGKTFECSASSKGGKVSQQVTIKRDATAPALTVPGTIIKQDAPAGGAVIDYKTTSTDPVKCSPASGTRFPIGATKVACTSTDMAGNATAKEFDVFVLRGAEPAPAPAPAPAVTQINMTGPAATAAAPKQINALLAFRFVATKKITRLKNLTVKNLPHGSMVTITCKGASCPKQLKGRQFAQKLKGSSINITRLVKGPLKAGTVITVVVSSPDAQPTTKTLTVRKGKAPQVG